MTVFLAFTAFLGTLMACAVYGLCRAMGVPMPWEDPDRPTRRTTVTRPTQPEFFMCEGCGTGPWDIEWDPPRQPVIGRRGGRFCPNCSGAD